MLLDGELISMTLVRVRTENIPLMETSFGTSKETCTAPPLEGGALRLRYRLRADAFRKRLHRECYLQLLGS